MSLRLAGHPKRGCRCTPVQLAQMNARVSGPVLDRLDLQVEVPALTADELQSAEPSESAATVRARVCAARERQRARGFLNSMLPDAALRKTCALDRVARALVTEAIDRSGLSARGVMRALRVARTISDLDGAARVGDQAVAEALMYRAYEGRRAADDSLGRSRISQRKTA